MKKLLILALVCLITSCQKEPQPTAPAVHYYETDDTQYVNGEVLYPDYIHSDTLVVTDAAFLNWCMRYYNAECDGDISDILRTTTEKL